jgi:hypothetical protein
MAGYASLTRPTIIKFFCKLTTGGQPSRQKPGGRKPGFDGKRCILFQKKEGSRPMPVFKYFTVVGSALLAFLFVSDAYFDDSDDSRFNGSLFESAIYAPRSEETAVVAERRFTRDATPTDRVKEVFALFVPNESRRGKRYSSAATVIR